MRRICLILMCVSFLIFPVSGAEPQEKYVALTFDDGPSGPVTQRLLDGLKQRGVKATFLVCGYRLRDFPQTARRIHAEGHEMGLHGSSHGDMGKMTHEEVKKELEDTLALLPKGCKPVFLRPPGGSIGPEVTKTAAEKGISVLLWSVDPRDWATKDVDAVEAAVVENIRSGDVVLLHDLQDSSVDAALKIIDRLQRQGFRFVTASQLAKLRGIPLRPGKIYRHFR